MRLPTRRSGDAYPDFQSVPHQPTGFSRWLLTAGWVLLVRPRAANYLVEDIRRLKGRLAAGDSIPAGPACLVTPPSDEVANHETISFRGLCSGSHTHGELRELYLPLPHNQEQETIVGMLERAPGVSVQGPPGTGKTHTIANIICHYLATGRKVLVTSKGEHALEVLQEKIPRDVRPLTVALLSGDKEGMRQFQASINAIILNLSQLNARATEGEIERCKQHIDAAHAEVARIDKRVDAIATQQLASFEVDGVQMRAQRMAELVVSGRDLHGWFDDELTLDAVNAPPLSFAEAQELREARRVLGADLVYASARLPSSFDLLPVEEVGTLHDALVGIREIDGALAEGELRALRALTPEVLEEARRMLVAVDHVLRILHHLEEFESPWVFDHRTKCRRPEFASEHEALKALLAEADALVQAPTASTWWSKVPTTRVLPSSATATSSMVPTDGMQTCSDSASSSVRAGSSGAASPPPGRCARTTFSLNCGPGYAPRESSRSGRCNGCRWSFPVGYGLSRPRQTLVLAWARMGTKLPPESDGERVSASARKRPPAPGKSMQAKRQLTPSMHQPLASLLFPEYRRRVLGLLLLRPEESLHGREVARRTGLPAGTIARELTKLAEAGLLRREKRGNQQVYSANTSGPIFAELASILRKTSGLGDVLSSALAPLAGRVKLAFVFGSVARGEEATGSDIDVLLVGEAGFREVVEALYPAQAILGREINPKVFAADEFAAKARAEPFMRDVLSRPKIFLIGNADDLEELAGHQP